MDRAGVLILVVAMVALQVSESAHTGYVIYLGKPLKSSFAMKRGHYYGCRADGRDVYTCNHMETVGLECKASYGYVPYTTTKLVHKALGTGQETETTIECKWGSDKTYCTSLTEFHFDPLRCRQYPGQLQCGGQYFCRVIDASGATRETNTITIYSATRRPPAGKPHVNPEPNQAVCEFNPCGNGGSCSRRGPGYVCSCRRGFTGKTCDSPDTSDRPDSNGHNGDPGMDSWIITVETGICKGHTQTDCEHPGTDGNVSIRIEGTKGKTDWIALTHGTGNSWFLFEEGHVDVFPFKTSPVGVFKKAYIQHIHKDNIWKCKKVTVHQENKDSGISKTRKFNCSWIEDDIKVLPWPI